MSRKAVLPALIAVGGGLVTIPAGALELGELEVQSKLGQPLRASIAYALGPNEIIDSYCVSIQSSSGGGKLADSTTATVSAANGVISLTGRSVILEPLMLANVVVNCPYTPHVSRNYTMFVDPVDMQTAVAAAEQLATAAQPAVAPTTTQTVAIERRAPATLTAIEQGVQYRVQPGDSLSRIAQRLQDRQVGLSAAMNVIFVANADAFINNDPNRLKAGSLLLIPSLAGNEITPLSFTSGDSEQAATEPPVTTVAVTDTIVETNVYDGAETIDTSVADEPASTEPVEEVFEAAPAAVSGDASSTYDSAYADLQPGDVVIDTTVEPLLPAASPSVAAPRVIRSPATKEPSWNWLLWLAAGGMAIVTGVLMFGQRLRERFGSSPVGARAQMPRQQSVQGTPRVAPIAISDSEISVEEIKPVYDDIDFDLSDDSPTEENLALDADLVIGTGLDESTDVDVNQDFGFAATTDLDLELPLKSMREDESPETDILPPLERTQQEIVVDSEILPDDSQYNMSVIIDATKMPDPAEVTERDLKAVPVEDNGQTLISDNYSINKEVDFETLEKDYEDELTATHALNMEIEKAAAELTVRMDDDEAPDGETSVEMQLANLSDLDMTSNLEAQNDDVGDDNDVTANISADDKTVEMPKSKGSKAS